MSLFCEVNGTPTRVAEIVLPYQGIWHADVKLDRTVALDGALTITLGGLVLQGVRYRSGDFVGSTSHRVLGGAGGWGKVIPAKFYYSPFSVKSSTVMQDAAKETGETLVISSGGGGLGNYYARMEAPGARVLDTLAPTWWMRTDGKTEVGVRVSKVIVSKFDVLKEGTNLALGKITIATDNPEDWQPGAQFLAPQFGEIRTVSSAVHKLDGGKLRTEAWINP